MTQQIATHGCETIGHIPWNKGRIIGQKTTLKATGHLVNSGPLKDEKEVSRSCNVQPCN